MISINKNTVNATRPRVGQFGGLRIKGQGDLSGSLLVIVRGDTTAPTAYVVGDLVFLDYNTGMVLGTSITLNPSSSLQNIRIKATSLDGGYFFISNQQKLNSLGTFDSVSFVFSNDWLGGVSLSDVDKSASVEFHPRLIPATSNTLMLNNLPANRYIGCFSELPPNIKGLYLSCNGIWSDYFPVDFDSLLSRIEVIDFRPATTVNGVVAENPIDLSKGSTALKSIWVRGFKMKAVIDGTKFPNLENLVLRNVNNTNGQPHDLVVNPNTFTKLRRLEFNSFGTVGVANVDINLDMDTLPSTLTHVVFAYDTPYTTLTFTDVGKLPVKLAYLYFQRSLTNTLTYTKRSWNISIDTFSIPSVKIETSALDNLLIDLNAEVTWTGSKVLILRGTRTTASDAAVASLVAKGVTVTINT